MERILIVGLRNPGKDFERTRHNIGARVVQAWKEMRGEGSKHKTLIPETYMNDSGISVATAAKKSGIVPEQVLVVHDDMETPFGEVRIKTGGSSKGHNGVKSIQEMLGTQEIPRVLVGVGRPPENVEPADFVLQNFSKEEEGRLASDIIPVAVSKIEEFLSD